MYYPTLSGIEEQKVYSPVSNTNHVSIQEMVLQREDRMKNGANMIEM